MKKRKEGECKLCLKQKQLCESHIYPKFFINHIRDKKTDNKFFVLSDKPIKKPIQDGPKEYLLCEGCERQIKLHEDHYKYLFFDRKKIEFIEHKNFIEIKGYNYKSIRLFVLSLLWRLSITTLPGWNITMNELDQELLRKQIYDDLPMLNDVFPFYTIYLKTGKYKSELFMNPKSSITNQDLILLYIFEFVFIVSRKRINPQINALNFLTPEIWKCKAMSIDDMPFIAESIKSINL